MNVPPVLGLPTCESLNLVQRVMTVGNDQSSTKEMKSNDKIKYSENSVMYLMV